MEHPQTNNQVEPTNKVILNELKEKLRHVKGWWDKGIPSILGVIVESLNLPPSRPLFNLPIG